MPGKAKSTVLNRTTLSEAAVYDSKAIIVCALEGVILSPFWYLVCLVNVHFFTFSSFVTCLLCYRRERLNPSGYLKHSLKTIDQYDIVIFPNEFVS